MHKPFNLNISDAQATLGFVQSQTQHVEAEVVKQEYPAITYPVDVPVDTTAPDWATSVAFFTSDIVGKPKLLNGSRGDDINYVNTTLERQSQPISMAGIGYEWGLEEIQQAAMLGMSLSADGASAAREVYERFADDVAYVGNTQMGVEGLLNNSAVATNAAGAAWAISTAQVILTQINGVLTNIMTTTNGIERANVLILDIVNFGLIATRTVDDTSSMTILEFIKKSNVYTATTGQPLEIKANHRLTAKMVAYRKSPEVVKFHIPLSLRFLPVQANNLQFKVPGYFRLAGVDFRRPKAAEYLTGI